MPPVTPLSMLSVSESATPSSAATDGMPAGTPMPRLVTAPGVTSMAARRAITLRSSSGIGARVSTGTRMSPHSAGSNCVAMVCMWWRGSATTT